MKQVLTILFFLPLCLCAQTFYYINDVEVIPENPVVGEQFSIHVFGEYSSSGGYLTEASAYHGFNNILLTIDAESSGGLTVLTAHDTIIEVGVAFLPGEFNISFAGQNMEVFITDSSALQFTISTVNSLDETVLDMVSFEQNESTLTVLNNGDHKLESLDLVDLNGRVLYSSQNISKSSHQIPVAQLSQGIYHLIYRLEGLQGSRKVFIE